MPAHLIGHQAIERIIETIGLDRIMDDAIEELTIALANHNPQTTEILPRHGFVYRPPQVGVLEWMPVMHADGAVLVKLVSYNPTNPDQQALPTIMSTMALFDASNGRLQAITDGIVLTAIRTGASSAVASRVLARPDSRVVGLVGCGAQAVTQLHALSRVFDIKRVLAFDTDSAAAASLGERVKWLGLPVEPASPNELQTQSDIICTATTVAPGQGPVIDGQGLKAHVHINAVGSDLPGKTELPLALLQAGLVCPDFPEQASKEGECQQLPALASQGPSFDVLLQQRARFEAYQPSLTVFDSTGFVLADLVMVRLMQRYANTLDLGTRMDIEAVASDPKNPYSLQIGSLSNHLAHQTDANATALAADLAPDFASAVTSE